MWKFYEIQISVSINKDLLEDSHVHLQMTCGYFCTFVLQQQNPVVVTQLPRQKAFNFYVIKFINIFLMLSHG